MNHSWFSPSAQLLKQFQRWRSRYYKRAMVDQPLSFTKGWRSFIATAIVSTGAVSASSLVLIPAAEANHYHHRHHARRKLKREFRRDVRDFNHYRRSYNRDWRHRRRIHNRALYDYPRVIAPYGYGYYRQLQPGFGIQIRLWISLLSGNLQRLWNNWNQCEILKEHNREPLTGGIDDATSTDCGFYTEDVYLCL